MSTAVHNAPVPWLIVLTGMSLLILGLTGIERADQLSDGVDLFPRQMTWVMLGGPLAALAAAVPYRRLQPYSYGFLAATLPLLVLVFWMPARNGARCWIPLGVFDLQPSELAKLALIFALAQYLSVRSNDRRWSGLVVPFLVTLIPVALILKEPDLGSAMLFLPVLFAMLFAAGARGRHLLLVALLGLAALPAVWAGMNAEQRSRITALFSQADGGPAPQGDGYHQHQSKLVLSLGGVLGSELGGQPLDDPDAYHLPAGQTDFVFCWVGERWGLWGAVLTLLLYLLLFGRGLQIAAATREPFGRLLAVGITALLAAQTIINTGMTVGLMPIAGITLPLMSYGGSSLLSTCIALGLLINIGMRPDYQMAPEPFRFRD
ncbi:MAG: FtsW/RodA/SpoVE family cell cycle protein [Planctomycetaceae bacterium]|nr:FtsW/RodA/SpoVE family cell cycle protein [Planctomycetaceae bacterium]